MAYSLITVGELIEKLQRVPPDYIVLGHEDHDWTYALLGNFTVGSWTIEYRNIGWFSSEEELMNDIDSGRMDEEEVEKHPINAVLISERYSH